MLEPIVIVHGGAGNISDDRVLGKINGVKLAAKEGYKVLQSGGNVLDAVEKAVNLMEDDENFNAGYGSVLTLDGQVEMDASIMDGATLNAGAVTVVTDVKYPITLARVIMEKSPHVLLAGDGARKFAKESNLELASPGALVSPNALNALEGYKQHGRQYTEYGRASNIDVGTVGAVAIDKDGNIAAATSTGGIMGKMSGRSSDTSHIGSGTYADNKIGGVSTTGHGETIMKFCLAHEIIKRMEYGKDAQCATKSALEDMTKRLKNTAGAITISASGNIGIHFSSTRMAWAYQKGDVIHFGIEHEDDDTETVA